MNRALWNKAISDAWVQLVASAVALCLFSWLFVWLMSFLKFGAWSSLLGLVPDFFRPMMGLPIQYLASPAGQLSFLFVHVITMLVCAGWAIGRGSDIVAGEIARGTMEHLLTLPVWRVTILIAPAVVMAAGAAVLALAVWAGIALGLVTTGFQGDVPLARFLLGSVNLFTMMFCLAGVTTFLSAFEHDRWRVIWRAGGFFVVSLIVKLVARMWPDGDWLKYLTFLSAFEPQRLVLIPGEIWPLAWQYNLALVAAGLVAYAAAALVFWYRDIPVPH
jgi:ABC-2 type transport system permease protein